MTHDEIYCDDYYRAAEPLVETSAVVIANSIARDFAPRTVLDVGCGSGAVLAELAARGIDVAGLEYSHAALDHCLKRGLRVYRFDLESGKLPPVTGDFDLVLSLEVAEHLPSSVAGQFVDLLTTKGSRVAFTAATPGQGGTDHVNEQPHEYWIEQFDKRGFAYAGELSSSWRKEWEGHGVAWWYCRNLMVFEARTR